MKKKLFALLCAGALLCGCAASPAMEDPTTTPTTVTEPQEQETLEIVEQETVEATIPTRDPQIQDGDALTLGQTGCARIAYTYNVSSVRYVTSADEISGYPELAAYDEAYFQDHALLVVLETTGSGSVKVGIESVVEGRVALSHEMTGDVGTSDMATWLLWAEVEKGLTEDWVVVNSAMKSSAVSY